MKITTFFVDSFTDTAFSGNPAAVCLLPGTPPPQGMGATAGGHNNHHHPITSNVPLTDLQLQQIASELNLSETVFITPLTSYCVEKARSGGGGGTGSRSTASTSTELQKHMFPSDFSSETSRAFHIRWFSPKCEIGLCGHATLAAAHVLLHSFPTSIDFSKPLDDSMLGFVVSAATVANAGCGDADGFGTTMEPFGTGKSEIRLHFHNPVSGWVSVVPASPNNTMKAGGGVPKTLASLPIAHPPADAKGQVPGASNKFISTPPPPMGHNYPWKGKVLISHSKATDTNANSAPIVLSPMEVAGGRASKARNSNGTSNGIKMYSLDFPLRLPHPIPSTPAPTTLPPPVPQSLPTAAAAAVKNLSPCERKQLMGYHQPTHTPSDTAEAHEKREKEKREASLKLLVERGLSLDMTDVMDFQLHQGSRKYLLVLNNVRAVHSAILDVQAMKDAMCDRSAWPTAPLSVTITAAVSREEPIKPESEKLLKFLRVNNFDVCSRHFAPWVGINEDPVTGAAHVVLAPYWLRAQSRLIVGERLRCYQDSVRGGSMVCELHEPSSPTAPGSGVSSVSSLTHTSSHHQPTTPRGGRNIATVSPPPPATTLQRDRITSSGPQQMASSVLPLERINLIGAAVSVLHGAISVPDSQQGGKRGSRHSLLASRL